MNKSGDIRMIFGNPVKCEWPDGQARLIEKISDQGILEQWLAEFTDNTSRKYIVLIRKENELEVAKK